MFITNPLFDIYILVNFAIVAFLGVAAVIANLQGQS
jgi:hypothetical protein